MSLTGETRCDCGRIHKPIDVQIVNESGALTSLPHVVQHLTDETALLLYDSMTHELLADRIEAIFSEAKKPVQHIVLGTASQPFEPNQAAVDQVTEAMKKGNAGLLIGVGAGAMNDLGKYVASQQNVPYISVATAPSMDGYMAPISALLMDGVKVTYDTKAPEGVVADLDVLAGAPLHLISAGFADVLGKLTSLRDWEMAHVLFDEYWCVAVSGHVEGIATGLYNAVDALAERSKESVRLLMEGLLEAGISVFHVGNSRPTSGSEHLVSHYVEMRSFNEGRRPAAHGHVVGFGMIVISELVQSMLQLSPDALRNCQFTPADVQAVVTELGFEEVPDNFGKSKFDRQLRADRLPKIIAKWDRIKEVLEKVPTPEMIRGALETMGAPTTLTGLGIDEAMGRQMVMNARYMRERYTMLDLAADTGVLEREADRIVAKYI